MRSEATQLVPPQPGLEAEIRSLRGTIDGLADQVGHLYGRARALEELKDELAPIARDALSALQGELVAMEHEFNSDEVVYLLRKLLRATPRFIWLLDRLESAAALVQELEPLVKEVGRAGIERLDEAERRGYFRLLGGALDLLGRAAAHTSRGDLEALSRSLPAILDAARGLAQPRVLGLARSVLEAAGRESPPPKVTAWGLLRALRSPEVQQGLGLALEMLRGVARAAPAAPEIPAERTE